MDLVSPRGTGAPSTVAGVGHALKRILLVKTSSLGDVVHNFPVASDIRRQFPDAVIDWVVEEAFVTLVRMHPAIRRVLPVALRRWRKAPLLRSTWSNFSRSRSEIAMESYDAIIDTQGLIKSALISCMANGPRHGYDYSSAREPFASRFYQVRHRVANSGHAVDRNRELAALSLGYRADPTLDFGLHAAATVGNESNKSTIVLLHSTSRVDKLWSESRWIDLGRRLEQAGLSCILPWGSEGERDRSRRIAAGLGRAEVPDRLSIPELASLLARAKAVVGVDTGLVHLSAALGTAVVALFMGTDPLLTGVCSSGNAVNLGGIGREPGVDDVLDALKIS